MYMQVLPLLWLYHHIAHKVCRDVAHSALARLLKLQAMTQLHLYDQALQLLTELLTGSGLPTTTTDHNRLVETHWVRMMEIYKINDCWGTCIYCVSLCISLLKIWQKY